MNPMWSAALGAVIRFGLAILAKHLVDYGIWESTEAANYVMGATLGILALGWSLWGKYKGRVTFLTALAMPKGTTEMEVKTLIAGGLSTPSVSTPADISPRLGL